jgi:hypothetical protein
MGITNFLLNSFQKLRASANGIPYVIPTTKRSLSAQVFVSSYECAAAVISTPQNMGYILNNSTSVLMDVRRVMAHVNSNSAYSANGPLSNFGTWFVSSSLPTGGQTSPKVSSTSSTGFYLFDTSDVSDDNCNLFWCFNSDGSNNAITWTPPAGTPMWRTYPQGSISVSIGDGQIREADEMDELSAHLIPMMCDHYPITLRQGDALVFRGVTQAPSGRITVSVVWEEYTI